jgi:hypothetical protein
MLNYIKTMKISNFNIVKWISVGGGGEMRNHTVKREVVSRVCTNEVDEWGEATN